MLASIWGGALAGVALSVAWITAPRVLVAASYVALGWVAVITMPQLADRLGVAPLVLFAAGGVIYSAGAAVYAFRRPNPWPRMFGFHEIFHALVIIAAVTHFVAIAGWVIPAGERRGTAGERQRRLGRAARWGYPHPALTGYHRCNAAPGSGYSMA